MKQGVRLTTRMQHHCGIALVVAVMAACGGAESASVTGRGAAGGGNAEKAAEKAEPSVPTATMPEDPCAWIPVADVEAAVGPLAGPPTRKNGCRYTLVIPEEVRAKRQQMIDRTEQLRARFKDSSIGDFGGSMGNYERDPATYAVTLSVDVTGNMAGEMGTAAAGRILQSWMPESAKSGPAEKPKLPEGWDSLGLAPYGFSGRVGHVQVSVLGEAPDVPRAVAKALADRVRDAIPDRPFPITNPYQVIKLGAEPKSPCSLLTRAEAEAVLGPLTVEPYRASAEWPPLVHDKGYGCSYYTAGHHVFTLVPSWRDGQEDFKMEKGLGSLMATVLPQDLLVIKGPWDQAHVSGATGALLFLKGDQLLEVHYKTSSTDMRGAVKLAAQAMKRMSS